jgi:hypothetical protein
MDGWVDGRVYGRNKWMKLKWSEAWLMTKERIYLEKAYTI